MFSRNKGDVADGLRVRFIVGRSIAFSAICKDSILCRVSIRHSCNFSSVFSSSNLNTCLLVATLIRSAAGLLIAGLVSISISSAQAASPFTTEGKFSVGSDGSANYSIPIVVPPGTAGMQPQLALNYNSNGGNGIVGMGWGIDGLSQISRCPTTLEQDGVINGVNYTNTDRFCLDGQRLIATTDSYVTHPTDSTRKIYTTTSAYGANGTEYRTESANFAKIISYGQAGTGPAYFKVWTKSGQIIEYGNTVDSGIEAQGKPTIRTWGVNKISDTKGNYIAVTYTEDNANGEAYVQKIDYTGNAASSTPALTPYANVQFVYETRPDITTAYQAGSVLKTTKRLTNIQTYNATSLIKNYKLTYELSQATQRSRIKNVAECDGNASSICKNSNDLVWVKNLASMQYGTSYTNNLASLGINLSVNGLNVGTRVVDINGDGLPDIIQLLSSSNGWYGNVPQRFVYLNTGSGFVKSVSYTNSLATSGINLSVNGEYVGTQIVDIDGDGLPDIIQLLSSSNGWYGNVPQRFVYLNTGSGFVKSVSYTNSLATSGINLSVNGEYVGTQIVDIDGDGLPDIIQLLSSSNGWYGNVPQRFVYLNTGSGFVKSVSYTNSVAASGIDMSHNGTAVGTEIVDINGDGLPDIIQLLSTSNGWYGNVPQRLVYLNTGSGFVKSVSYTNSVAASGIDMSHNGTAVGTEIVDINGDGLPDIIQLLSTSNGWYGNVPQRLVYLNTGSGFVKSVSYTNSVAASGIDMSHNGTDVGTEIVDIDGDGLPDIIQLLSTSNGWYGNVPQRLVYLNTGSGFVKSVSYTNSLTSAGMNLSVNGSYVGTQLADLNGDGLPDIIQLLSTSNGWYGNVPQRTVFLNLGKKEFIQSFQSGEDATSFTAQPITVSTSYAGGATATSAVYSKDSTAVYPLQDIQGPMYVVSSTSVSDGIGGEVTTNYQYGGLKAHLRGRGSLGFRYVKESSPDSGLGVTTFYRQDFPFIGLPSQVEKHRLSDNALLSIVQNTYASSDLATSTMISKFPYLSQSAERVYELDAPIDSPTTITTTTNQYDDYGNVTSVKVDDGLGNIRTTTSTYSNNVGNWLLGRLIRSTVTSVTP